MRVTTLNVNGLRSAEQKGLFPWVLEMAPDVLCLQETRASSEVVAHDKFKLPGYEGFFTHAEKKGYSGTAIYTKHAPDRIIEGFSCTQTACEGRYLQADFGDLSIVSAYFPSGTSGDIRQAVKYDFLDAFFAHLQQLLTNQRTYIFCGDFNIAHTAKDLKNWRANQVHSGFLPAERAWMDKIFALGLVDAFRVVNQNEGEYTWWSNRGEARAKNVGWRIDYQITTPDLHSKIHSASIYKAQRFSDHAPLNIEYTLTI